MDSKSLEFEQKIKVAKELLKELSSDDITLSKSVKIYKDGLKELKVAQKLLDDAKFEFQEILNEKESSDE